MNPNDNTQKLTPEHLARTAVVYLRQSSMRKSKTTRRANACSTP